MGSFFPLGKFQRLASMGANEISSRIRQELAKNLDSLGLFPPSFESLPVEILAQAGRFFFDQGELLQRIHLIREHIPDFEESILGQAEQILNHRFPLLGYGTLDYDKDIDWQLDIVNGTRAPLKPWPKISYLDFHQVGDSKVTWELSRHQFLPTLAKAWLLTGEERFVRKLENLYYDWHRKNPYPLGINWASSLEVAFRSLAWVWTAQLLGGCESATKLRQDITQALGFNAWYIRRYLSTYFSPNTHLQGEAVALYFIGTLFPSLPNAKDWRETGWNVLLEHALTKVLEDGAYFEQSTYYHVYALDFFLHARILAERNGKPFPDSYDAVLQKMLMHLACLCQAGPPPRFGDDDGGRVFDGRRNLASHLSDPLAIGTALYQCADFKQPGVQATEEMLWLFGEEGLKAFSDCPASESGQSAQFDQTGLYTLLVPKLQLGNAVLEAPASGVKSSWSLQGKGSQAGAWEPALYSLQKGGEVLRSQLVFDTGPWGGGSGGHGHADALSLTLNLDGKPVVIDPGTCNYVGPGSDREDFRVTSAHNTVTVDGLSQAIPKTAFSWFQWPKVSVDAVVFTPDFEFIAAAHDGYTRLQHPVTHRRTLFAPHVGFWFVLDELVSDGPHDYTLHWHFAPGSNVEREAGPGWSVGLEGNKLHILTTADGWLSTLESSWFSPAYGAKQAAPVLNFTKHALGNESIATILWAGTSDRNTVELSRHSGMDRRNPDCRDATNLCHPWSLGSGDPCRNDEDTPNSTALPPKLVVLVHSSGVVAYCLANDASRSLFLFGDGVSTLKIEAWESDASFLYSVSDADGRLLTVIALHSSFVRYNGQTLHDSTEKEAQFVWREPNSD